MTKTSKMQLHSFGLFSLILLVMFLFLFLIVFFTRNNWNNGLRNQVAEVVQNVYAEKYQIGNTIPITLPIAVSAAAFEVTGKNTPEKGYAVILRMTGMSGPVAGVYLVKPGQSTPEFLGTTGFPSNSEDLYSWNSLSFSLITYWGKRIPFFIEGNI